MVDDSKVPSSSLVVVISTEREERGEGGGSRVRIGASSKVRGLSCAQLAPIFIMEK